MITMHDPPSYDCSQKVPSIAWINHFGVAEVEPARDLGSAASPPLRLQVPAQVLSVVKLGRRLMVPKAGGGDLSRSD